MRLFALFVGLALAWAPCVGARALDGALVQPLLGGTPSADAAVVALVQADGSVACTGTLIRPHVVLTAAHCVKPSEAVPYAIVAGPSAEVSAGIRVSRWLRHPEYTEETLSSDVALLGLADSPDAQPLEVWDAPPPSGYPGLPIRLVGYGCTEVDDAGVTMGTGMRRTREDMVEALTDAQKLRHAESTCVGDSGGPVLARGENGVERIVALTSSGGSDDAGPFALATPLPPHARWVARQADALESELAPAPAHGGNGCHISGTKVPISGVWLILGLAAVVRGLCRAKLCLRKPTP